MAQQRAALVTGASSGIGLGIARTLGAAGYRLTLAARRPEKLEGAAEQLRGEGYEVVTSAGDLSEEAAVVAAVDRHREAYGRLDVLVNNAGVGIGQLVGDLTTKAIDLQLGTNLRSIFLFYREALPMLREAGQEHRNALVVNVSSYSGIKGEKWIGVYSATKRGLVGYTQAMNDELNEFGIRSTALCPAYVDTPMAAFVKERVGADRMITVADVANSVAYLLTLSPGCLIQEIQFEQPSWSAAP
jgi:ketoreductase